MFDGMLDALAGVDWYTTLALCVACSFLLSRAALTPRATPHECACVLDFRSLRAQRRACDMR